VVELRFAIKAGYANDDQTGHLPPKPAKTIACHNDGKNFTAQSFADDRCVLTACSFTVPENRLAVQFKVQSLTPGSGCYTGMPSETAGFLIVRSGTQQILFNYIGVVTPNPAGLSALNLRPGNYLLQTSVARNSGVSLTFMIENPFEAALETSSAAPLAGVWAADFNHFGGTLTVNPNGSATLNQGSGLETLTDMRYDAASGRITFTRMLPNHGPQQKQVYTGRLTREGHAEGTFDCTVSGKGFPWKIERTSKAAANAQSDTAWTGTWQLSFQGGAATLKTTQSGNRVSGSYDWYGGKIEGTVKGNVMTGTWTNTAGSGPFEWKMAPDGRSFQGFYIWQGANYAWGGTRIQAPPPR
jgi:hypothetical protein